MNQKHVQPSPEVHTEIKTKIAAYQSKLLNPEQVATMLPRMRELVLAADPKSMRDAKCLLSTLARFLVDVVPAEGGNVDDFLTNVEIARWSNQQHGSKYTLSQNLCWLKRLLRVKAGLPSQIRALHKVSLSPEPLNDNQLDLLINASIAAGEAACRGFAVAIGVGWMDHTSFGATFIQDDTAMWSMNSNNARRAAHPIVDRVSSRWGDGVVREGDWFEFRQAALRQQVHINDTIARQTFRRLVFALNESVAVLMRRYQISYKAIEALMPHLDCSVVIDDALISLLRGDELSACSVALNEHCVDSPRTSGVHGGDNS
jgi:hypothetical protein